MRLGLATPADGPLGDMLFFHFFPDHNYLLPHPPTPCLQTAPLATCCSSLSPFKTNIITSAVLPLPADGSLGDMLFFHTYKNPGLVLDIVQVRCTGRGAEARLPCWLRCPTAFVVYSCA